MKKRNYGFAIIAAAMALSLAGCAENNTDDKTSDITAESNIEFKEEKTEKADNFDNNITESDEPVSPVLNAETEISPLQLSESDNENELFTARDLEQTADTSNAEKLSVTDGKTISITSEGTYVLSGSANECTVKIDADENSKIQIVLDNVSVTNSSSPVIYSVSADKVFVTTTNTENTMTVTGQFAADGQTNTDAVIYSKNDIVLNGTGTLNINSASGNGITGKDDMKITGGTYFVKSELDAFEANDSILINDGIFSIETNKDGFHCENDNTEGSINVLGGTFDITGGSDGFQACALLQIDGGTMNISAPEGLEATYIIINDGTIRIDASDDGINASRSSNLYDTSIEINGGDITVAVGQGDTDAIDSNGSIYVNGGKIDITSQMSSFDADGTTEFNGGTIIINGTEVSEIPQSMMGGGRKGNMKGERGGSSDRII